MQTPVRAAAFALMMRFLFPRLRPRDAGWMLLFGLAGAVIAGVYGVLHDQVTFSIGPEYFTRFKVWQFHYHDDPGPQRWVAAKIGFQASWAVGFFAGWFFGRLAVPKTSLRRAAVLSLQAVTLMLAVTLVGGAGGWAWARWRLNEARIAEWAEVFRAFEVGDMEAFATVGCIHDGSYLGALLGLIVALLWLRQRLRIDASLAAMIEMRL